MAQAASGHANRFITLTASMKAGINTEERLHALSHAWRVIMLRLRRLHPGIDIQYLVIVEATKHGEPHLHILYRGPFIPQRVLSHWMSQLISSPICDIRKVRSQRELIRYVAKYVTKKPAQFGTSKRYWQSRGYQLPDPEREAMDEVPDGAWTVDYRPLYVISFMCETAGYEVTFEDESRFEARAPPYRVRPEYDKGIC